MRSPKQAAEDAAYAREFERRSSELYEQLRDDVKNELLNGQPSAEAPFAEYQNHLNDAALRAAESKSGDYHQSLGVSPSAGPSEIRQAYWKAIQANDTELHPYPEYSVYTREIQAAYDALSKPAEKVG